MIKKFLTMLLASAIILSFSACSLAVPDDDNVDGNNLPAFGTDKMVGFFAVIYDGEGNPLTSTDFESDDAVKYYREQVKFDDGTGDYYIAFTSGADVLGNVRLRHTSGADEGLEIDVDLNFTYELEGSVMCLYGVYFDEENWSYYVNAELTVVALSSMSGSEISQNLRATANMDDDEEQTITYTCSVNIDLIYTDYLTQVNIFEFDAGNNVSVTANQSDTLIDAGIVTAANGKTGVGATVMADVIANDTRASIGNAIVDANKNILVSANQNTLGHHTYR